MPLTIRLAVLAMASPPMDRLMASAFSLRQPISNQPFCGEANEAPVNKILYSVVFDRFCAATCASNAINLCSEYVSYQLFLNHL